MDDSLEFKVPGQDITKTPYRDNVSKILSRIREICGWGRPTFPGSQPVSLSITNITQLASHPYVACEKTDGVRYLLYAASRLVFLIDRKETITVLNMCLPLPGLAEDTEGRIMTHQSTLLDGELVSDKTLDGGTKVSFLIYDAISINRDTTIAKRNLLERLKQTLLNVTRPRVELEEVRPDIVEEEKRANSYLPIYLKDFYEIWDILSIKNSQPRLPHLSDGLIFTPIALPYVPGTCKQLMKWKPPELNTLDFASELLYALDTNNQAIPVASKLLIGSKGFRRDSGCWIVTGKGRWDEMVARQAQFRGCDGTIWECYFDPKAVTLIPALCDNGCKASEMLNKWCQFWKMCIDSNDDRKNIPEEYLHKVKRSRMSGASRFAQEILLPEDEAVSYGYPQYVTPIAKSESTHSYYNFNECVVFEGGWVLERIRTDKTTPNDERVMQKVKESIDSGITFVALFDQILSYRSNGTPPVYKSVTLPSYYTHHGTRLQHTDAKLHIDQQASMHEALKSNRLEAVIPEDDDRKSSVDSSSSYDDKKSFSSDSE